MLADKHLLACAKCGQEMHHPCLLAKLQVTDVDSLNHEIVGHAINPLGLPGMHYLCKACTDANIPDDSTLISSTQKESCNKTVITDNSVLTSGERNKDDIRSPEKPLCKFYNQGNCKHGRSGKNCAFSHPPLCRKMINHGHNDKRGCKLSNDECKFHQPVICKSSLNRGVCYNKNCNKYHVHGTEWERKQNIQQATAVTIF